MPKVAKGAIFSLVGRDKALVNHFVSKLRVEQGDTKYEPKYTAVEAPPKKIVKWKLPE